MMKKHFGDKMIISVELLFVGNELLNGKITNTNAQWLCEKITKLGAQVNRITTIPDDVEIIADTLRDIIARKPDFIIISGGLGPTFDDMTLKGVEKALGENYKLELNQEALKMIEKQYELAAKLNIIKDGGLTEHRIKMASIPRNSIPLYNPVGTAPGVLIKIPDNIVITCLPGVPQEMKAIFKRSISSLIRKKTEKSGITFSKTEFIVKNRVESEIAPFVDKVMKEISGIWIKSHPKLKNGKAWVEVFISSRDDINKSKQKILEAKQKLIKLIEENGGIIELKEE
ncbi:MAG: molybdopterin-binding protein [Candidatus Helarchaeota archaeon]